MSQQQKGCQEQRTLRLAAQRSPPTRRGRDVEPQTEWPFDPPGKTVRSWFLALASMRSRWWTGPVGLDELIFLISAHREIVEVSYPGTECSFGGQHWVYSQLFHVIFHQGSGDAIRESTGGRLTHEASRWGVLVRRPGTAKHHRTESDLMWCCSCLENQ